MPYLRRKLKEGLDRIARENPALDFSADTPEMRTAEAELNNACVRWYGYKVSLSAVQKKFKVWESALLKTISPASR